MPMFLATAKDMRRGDWVWLFVSAAIMSACGVYGCSYVIGAGWPALASWAEVVLTVVFTPLVAGLFFLCDVGFTRFATPAAPAPLEEKTSPESDESKAAAPPDQPTKPASHSAPESPELPAPPSRARRILDTITPTWSLRSIVVFSLIMAVLWAPWYIANFPGGTYWDTYYQIYQVYPENHPIAVIPWAEIYKQTLTDAWLVDHHPVFTTLVYGLFGWVSDQATGNWMAGVAVFCALQGLAHILAFTAATAWLKKVGCPLVVDFIIYAFFALMPFISTWAMCMVKDSFFGLFFIGYFMMLFEAVRTRGHFLTRPRNVVMLVLCALALCLTKKTGIFVVVACAVVGALAFRRLAKGAVGAMLIQGLVSAVVMLVVLPFVLFPALNIQSGGAQETLGPLFQQTARYVLDYGDEVTPEEREAIAAVIDYDKLADQYRFDFQDSVKYRYNLDASTSDIARYLEVYLEQGLKHPDAYFAATVSLAGFYVAPTAFINIRMVTVDTKMGADQRYMLWNPDELDWLREGLDNAYTAIAEVPVLDTPLLIVTYALWLPLILAYIARRHLRNQHTSVIFTPAVVLLAFCIVAPVYDARYVVPLLDAAPLLFGGICALLCRKKNDHLPPTGDTVSSTSRNAQAKEDVPMNGIETIKARRSIREYSSKPIPDEVLHEILDAGMRGPSCVNARDWSFLVVRDKETLGKMADANGRPAEPLRHADVGILVCGDLQRAFAKAPDYWVIDASIACQNILLAATHFGIGSVWLGTYPQMERVNKQRELFDLPDTVMPHSLIALGYPKNEAELTQGSRSSYEESQVHFERW